MERRYRQCYHDRSAAWLALPGPYFHGDGFGKDFRVLNVTGADPPRELTDRLLLGNLLSFHEQLCAYRDNAGVLRDYNLEPPLWVFVGRSVNAVFRRNRRDTSDVLDVQLFLHRVLSDPAWAKDAIGRLLRGESGLYSAWNVDLFAGRFDELAKSGGSPPRIYADLLKTFFHADGPGGLRLWNSWRVSNMGLMNVGTGEGSEIIQLFGRGVRLKGRGMSLKRSTHLEGPHPEKAGELPLGLVDWEEAYLDLVEHRRVKGMLPLAVSRPAALRSFVENANVTVAADDHIFEPRAWGDREDLQEIVHTRAVRENRELALTW